MGWVNRCPTSLNCRLAKLRVLRREKFGAVIGQKPRFFVCAQCELPGYGFLISQSQRRIFLKPQNFAKRQFELQWLTPST